MDDSGNRISRLARFVLVALAVVATLAVLVVAAVIGLAVAVMWALGRLVAGFASTTRAIEQAYR